MKAPAWLASFAIYTAVFGAAKAFSPVDLCGDFSWSLYKDEKCWKLINQMVTYEEALQLCSQETGVNDAQPLVTISSEAEQNALSQLVFEDFSILDNVWLGARRGVDDPSTFEWSDGSPLEVSFWGPGFPTEDLEKNCTLITTGIYRNIKTGENTETTAFWIDAACGKRNLPLCQKAPTWSLSVLQQAVILQRRELETKSEQLVNISQELSKTAEGLEALSLAHSDLKTEHENLKHNPVPVGFVYVQLHNEPDPSAIWPQVTWTEVTSSYSGLFFRAHGGGSAAFGAVQEQNAPRLSKVNSELQEMGSPDKHYNQGTIDIPENDWSSVIETGDNRFNRPTTGNYCHGIKFYNSGGEIRPRNAAIRIWKRTA